MTKVCIQAGHVNIKYNSIVALHGSTGAPGELEFNQDVANQVSGALRERDFEILQTDANANDDSKVTGVDWDLFLAIHYDADVYSKPGGFTDFPEPATDGATQKSQAYAKNIADEYFKTTGIEYHPERTNANTRYFYMWKYLTGATPCVLIECGVGWRVPEDHTLFTYHREKVVEGIVRGVCKCFGVEYNLTPPITCEQRINEAVTSAETKKDEFWRPQLESANLRIEELKKLTTDNLTVSELFSLAWKKWWARKKSV